MKEPDCGGCKGQGAHSRRCRTQPGWLWRRFEDAANDLGDGIGSNDVVSANMAYSIAGRMAAKASGELPSEGGERCTCRHLRGGHDEGVGRCWATGCDCKRFTPSRFPSGLQDG